MIRRVERALSTLLILPACLPLLYLNGLMYPFVATKTFVLRGAGVLLLASILYLIFARRELFFDRIKNYWTWIPALLLLVAYMTSLFGVDFMRSLYSTFDRGDGLLTFTVLVTYFYAILLAAPYGFFERLAKVSLWVGGLIALYAFLQWLQFTTGTNIPLIEEPRGRYGSTFGNAAFMAAYLGLTIPLSLTILSSYRKKWLYAAYASIALQAAGIFLSATRGTILAGIAALGLYAIYASVRGEGKMRTLARGTLAVLCVIVALFIVFRSQLAQSSIEPIQRLASISIADVTVSSRVFVWSNMLGEIASRPLTGVGAEHVDKLFNKFYDPGLIVEEWFDRSHNAYLDYAAQYGLFGLLLYIALIVSSLRLGYVLIKKDEKIGVAIVLLTCVYAMQNFFVFDTALSLWLFLAVIAAGYVYDSKEKAYALKLPKLPSWTPMVAGAFVLILLIPVSIQPLRANRLLAKSYVYHVAEPDRALGYLKKGLGLTSYGDREYGYQMYNMYTDRQQHVLEGDVLNRVHTFALATLKENFENDPTDARTAVYYAHVLETTPPGVAIDEAELRRVLERAKELTPKRMQPWFIEANLDLRAADAMPEGQEKKERYRKGIQLLEEYAQTAPEYAEPRFVLANLYLAVGEPQKAAQYAAEGDSLFRGSDSTAKRAAKYYLAVEDWPKVVYYLTESMDDDETNYPILFDIAKAKYLAGDTQGAITIVNQLRSDSPETLETDLAFMAAIENLGE